MYHASACWSNDIALTERIELAMKQAATTSVHVDANVVVDTDGTDAARDGDAVATALTAESALWKKKRLEKAVGSLFNRVVV